MYFLFIGANINNSLMILGQVISKLSEGAKEHIPFRNSKLTRILKNSLGGNTKTAIMCCVTPAEEVQIFLKYLRHSQNWYMKFNFFFP